MITCDYNKPIGKEYCHNARGEAYTLTIYKSNAYLCGVYEYTDPETGEEMAQLADFLMGRDHAKNVLGLNKKGGYTENIWDGCLDTIELSADFPNRAELIGLMAKAHWEHPVTIKLS